MNPKFTIIVPHYQGVISHERFLEGIESLQNQTCQDFEILCYHDGPLLDDSVEFPIPVKCTDKRYNDWGHSLRDLGIQEAKGEYIIHFNPDNLLYPIALSEILKTIMETPFKIVNHGSINNNIIIFPIHMKGMISTGNALHRIRGNEDVSIVLTGHPCAPNFIDCMQFVMKTELWRYLGGWYDKSEASDGKIYNKAGRMNCGVRHYKGTEILGEHR